MHKSNTKKIKVKVLLQTEEMAPGGKCSIRKHADPSLVLTGVVMRDYNLRAGEAEIGFLGLSGQPA